MTLKENEAAEGGPSNRDRIVNAALRLLTERGYPNVSMRDIAAEVGIKASSIYNHFSGKDAVLDEIVEVFRRELRSRSMNEGRDISDEVLGTKAPKELLTEIMLAPIVLLEDPALRRIVRVVTLSQYYHAGIRAFLREEMFEKPQARLRRVLSRFAELGLVEPFPVDFLVAELQAVFTASFYQKSLGPEFSFSEDSREDLARTRAALALHVDFFWRAAAKHGRP